MQLNDEQIKHLEKIIKLRNRKLHKTVKTRLQEFILRKKGGELCYRIYLRQNWIF